MKVLHTADWHLGKRLEQCERTDEHQFFLSWLITKLNAECIDVLIIAGDIFDSGTPSNTALEQYYKFLWQVKTTCCQHVIIIGGNHDSVSTLNAPKELLKYFNIYVVAGVPDDRNEQIIPIYNTNKHLELVICAIPFLRDKDVRLSVTGEKAEEREARIKQGICDHYNKFREHIAPFKANGIPVIATGHLFASGSVTSESEKEIHVGNLGQICSDQFPGEFDYIALGHIHKPQIVNEASHIRYSGSPIPLGFSETSHNKVVVVLHFKDQKLAKIEEIEVPCCRKLYRIKGNLAAVKKELMLIPNEGLSYPAWVELQVETESYIHGLDEQLNQLIRQKPYIERLFTRQIRLIARKNIDEQTEEMTTLIDLSPKEVFIKRCKSEYPDTDFSDLLMTFEELLEQMEQ